MKYLVLIVTLFSIGNSSVHAMDGGRSTSVPENSKPVQEFCVTSLLAGGTVGLANIAKDAVCAGQGEKTLLKFATTCPGFTIIALSGFAMVGCAFKELCESRNRNSIESWAIPQRKLSRDIFIGGLCIGGSIEVGATAVRALRRGILIRHIARNMGKYVFYSSLVSGTLLIYGIPALARLRNGLFVKQ